MAAADITLLALAAFTTTTRTTDANGRVLGRPLEGDTEAVSATTDLGDDRSLAVSLAVQWDNTKPRAILEVAIDTSADQNAWREIGKFVRVSASSQDSTALVTRQSLSLAADRYVRVRYRIGKSAEDAGLGEKGSVKFQVTGRRT